MNTSRRAPDLSALAAMMAAFSTYFCMYAFRKPFTAAEFEGLEVFGIEYKIVVLLAQVAGYTLSKFTGIKVVSEMTPGRRIACILGFIAIAELALILFGLVSAPWNFVFLFLNGLPLGMIWGIVFSFLEGRRLTEFLGAGLCCAFIVASGVVKSVGKYLIDVHGVSEFWMPALTGAIFVIPLLISVAFLGRTKPPDEDDVEHRSAREPMSHEDRRAFFRAFAPGIVVLVVVYAVLNAYRDFRDNFAVEIWGALGFRGAGILTASELPIAVSVLVVTALMTQVKSNRKALWFNHWILFGGGAMVLLATMAYRAGSLDALFAPPEEPNFHRWALAFLGRKCAAASWMILVGLGMYLAYIAYHTFLWERLIATTRRRANVGYLMYLCDSFGYLASVGVMLYKSFGAKDLSWFEFFVKLSYGGGVLIMALVLISLAYFHRQLARGR